MILILTYSSCVTEKALKDIRPSKCYTLPPESHHQDYRHVVCTWDVAPLTVSVTIIIWSLLCSRTLFAVGSERSVSCLPLGWGTKAGYLLKFCCRHCGKRVEKTSQRGGGLIVSLGDRQRKPMPLPCWALACESWRTAKGHGSTFSGAGVGRGGDVLARGGAEGQRSEVAHIPGLQRNLAKSHWWLQPRVVAYTGEGAPGRCSMVGLSAMVGMSYSFLTLMFKHSRCAQCY